MITFKANYVSKAAIDRYYSQTNSKKHPASFVRLNPTDEKDILALLNTKNIWGKSEFGGTLYDRALFMHYDNENSEDKEIYLLTEQLEDYENLDANKILAMGLIMTRANNFKYLTYLQVKPNHMWENQKNIYKGFRHIGTEFLNCCKEKFKNFSLVLNATKESESFYLKNGFELINKDTRFMSYTKKLFKH